jgi:ArsR family transcriptional regulator
MTHGRRARPPARTSLPLASPVGGARVPGLSVERVVEILKTVAHPLRLKILALLCEGDAHVGGLAARLGVAPTIVSQSLAHLRHQQLVSVARRSRRAIYTLNETVLRDLISWAYRCTGATERATSRPLR